MDAAAIERVLSDCERALATERRPDLGRLGFWKAVAALKRRPDLLDRYADRAGRIDREAYLRAVPIALPAWAGVALGTLGSAAGAAALAVAPALPPPWLELAYLAGAGALIGMTHGLAHYVTGGLVGIRFTHFFTKVVPPQPGFKTDYATYLRAPARSRAWMHASGAIVSKVIPFLVVWLAAAGGAEPWAVLALLALGLLQLVTDATLSTRASDWKRFRREMRSAAG
jgi:hypothetical protein